MQTDVRPENAPASAPPVVAERPPVTAGSFRELVTTAKQVGRDDAVAVKQLAALERERQIEAMLLEHLDKHLWALGAPAECPRWAHLRRLRDVSNRGEAVSPDRDGARDHHGQVAGA
jgi:hypothetical protein